jgi:hypothetical protein
MKILLPSGEKLKGSTYRVIRCGSGIYHMILWVRFGKVGVPSYFVVEFNLNIGDSRVFCVDKYKAFIGDLSINRRKTLIKNAFGIACLRGWEELLAPAVPWITSGV